RGPHPRRVRGRAQEPVRNHDQPVGSREVSTATATSTYAAKATRFSGGLRAFVNEWMILFLFLALFAICAITIDRFLELGNLMNIARQISFLAIVALGQFFVILTAELDLSIGSSIGLQSVLLAGFVANSGFSVWAALA